MTKYIPTYSTMVLAIEEGEILRTLEALASLMVGHL